MVHIYRATRYVILGSDRSFAAQVGCGHRAILGLAGTALVLHSLDLVSGIRMMALYGMTTEQNPLARGLFEFAGPIGLSIVKLGVVSGGIAALVCLALHGRPRLARNALVLAGILGLLGFTSNLV